MMRPHLAIIGFGRLGKACAEVVLASDDVSLGGIVRRAEGLHEPLAGALRAIPVRSTVSQLKAVAGALVCVPTDLVLGIARDLLQHRIPIIECATVHGQAFQAHKDAIHRLALHYKVPAIVGAGWDPGALSLFRGLFALLTPKGHTETRSRPGVTLHHTVIAQGIAGVKDALCTERRTAEGRMQRFVYVELEKGSDRDRVIEAIRSDPQFLLEETFVFPVESVKSLEEEGHGVVLERWGATRRAGHQRFLLEARFDPVALAAQVMVAAARALPAQKPGAHSLLDVPIGRLWGERSGRAEQECV